MESSEYNSEMDVEVEQLSLTDDGRSPLAAKPERRVPTPRIGSGTPRIQVNELNVSPSRATRNVGLGMAVPHLGDSMVHSEF